MDEKQDSEVADAAHRGMSEGFERYLTPTDADYRSVMTGGMVVLDTSALLNLYRYTAPVRSSLLEVLRHLDTQLWEPHQVMLEFWRRRESAIGDYATAATQFDKAASTAKNTTVAAIRTLGNRIGLSEREKSSLAEPIEKAFAELTVQVVLTMNVGGAAQVGPDTGNDPVVLALDPILRGRVGEPFTRAEHENALAEGRKRIEAKRPPGFRDGGKSEGQAEGDYLLWAQILREAATRGLDVLLVTADAKDDWWRSSGTAMNAGPRHELLDEFHNAVGRRLFMLKPADLLAKAAALLHVQIEPESLDQARRVDQFPLQPVGIFQQPVSIYAFRTNDGEWHGQPDALPDGEYTQGTFQLRSTSAAFEFGGQDLLVRIGPIDAETSHTTCQVTLDDGRQARIPPTTEVLQLLLRNPHTWLLQAGARVVGALREVGQAVPGSTLIQLLGPAEDLATALLQLDKAQTRGAAERLVDTANSHPETARTSTGPEAAFEIVAQEALNDLRRAVAADPTPTPDAEAP